MSISIDVTMFGVIGDGTTDNTAAIRKLLNLSGYARNLYFPAGVYKITGVLPIGDNTIVRGDGIQRTIIRPFYASGAAFEGVFVAKCVYDNYPVGSITTGFKNITIQDLTVDVFANHVNPKDGGALPAYSYTNGCFWFYPPAQPSSAELLALVSDSTRRNKNLVLNNIEVIGGPYFVGEWLDKFGRLANGNWNLNLCAIDGVYIKNCILRGSGRDTINTKACRNLFIDSNVIVDSEDDCIVVGGGIESNWYYNPGSGGFAATYQSIENSACDGYDCVITNNVIKQASANGIKIFGQHGLTISNNIFRDINVSAIIFQARPSDSVTITNNIGYNIGNYIMSVLNPPIGSLVPFVHMLDENSARKHITISNNVIKNATYAFRNSLNAPLSYVCIIGNTLEGSATIAAIGSNSIKYILTNNISD